MKLGSKKKFAIFAFYGSIATAAYASCGGTEALVVTAVQKLAASVSNSMAQATTTIVTNSILSTDRIVGALKVVVKQESVATDKKNASMRETGEAFASTYSSQRSSEQIYDIYNRYRSQGYDVCRVSTMTKTLKGREVSVAASVPARVRNEIDAAPGRYGDPAVALQARVNEHKQYFCTAAEVSAGLCSSVGQLPGGDSNGTLLFKDAAANGIEAKAKNAFINNLFGLPTPIAKGKGSTPEGVAGMSDKHRIDAINSIAMHSLKTIQADHEKDPATNKSLAEMIKERVGVYFGTEQAKGWAQSLAAQEQRGILVDMVKMEGVALKMAERRVAQNARIEGNLAGLVALSAEKN